MPVAVATMAMAMARVIGRLGRDVVSGLGAAVAPEKLFELGDPNAFTGFTGHVQAILVDDHFRVLEPLAPCGLGDVIEHFLAELTFEGWLLQAFRLLTQLDALNGSRHCLAMLLRGGRPSTWNGILWVRLLDAEAKRHPTAIKTTADLGHLSTACGEHDAHHSRDRSRLLTGSLGEHVPIEQADAERRNTQQHEPSRMLGGRFHWHGLGHGPAGRKREHLTC